MNAFSCIHPCEFYIFGIFPPRHFRNLLLLLDANNKINENIIDCFVGRGCWGFATSYKFLLCKYE